MTALEQLIFKAANELDQYDGKPGLRSVDAPCFYFVPGKPKGQCEPDGHYLCEDCSERDPKWRWEWQQEGEE
jgi:hypothetical protein